MTGSLWFLARGWVAPNLATLCGAGPALSLLAPAALTRKKSRSWAAGVMVAVTEAPAATNRSATARSWLEARAHSP